MKLIPRRKKQPAKTVDTIVTALKLGAIVGAVRGGTKGAGKGAKKGVKRVAKRTPAVPRVVPIAIATGAGAVVVKKLRSNGSAAQPQPTSPPPVTAATSPS